MWYRKNLLVATQTATPPFATHKSSKRSSMFQTSIGVLKPFHALKELLASSSWFDQVPNFRQEIRQSNYRNDPVKYDLSVLISRL